MSNILGVFASFERDPYEKAKDILERRLKTEDIFNEYLWGPDHKSGLAAILKSLNVKYGDDLDLILFKFTVNPLGVRLTNPKELDSYRPKEKSMGAYILITEDTFFNKSKAEKDAYIKDMIITRLEQIRDRFKKRKLDVNMDKLIEDTKKVLDEALK